MKNITDIKYKKGKSSRGEIMKKVIIISLGNKTGKSLYEQLKSILDEKIYVNFYSIENHIPENLECDLIIFSSDTVKI